MGMAPKYFRARALNRSLLVASLMMTGLVLAYFSRNSSMVIVPSLISMLQGPGLATISLGYVLQPPAHNISAYNYL